MKKSPYKKECNMADIFEQISDIIKKIFQLDYLYIAMDTDLKDDLDDDDFYLTSILSKIEKKFEIKIDDYEYERVNTVKDIVDLVHKKLKE
jgi:acyl carrier protein